MINQSIAVVVCFLLQIVGIMSLIAGIFTLPEAGTMGVAAVITGGILVAAGSVGYSRYWQKG